MLNIGIIYLVLLGMIGLTLFLSSRMKSPYLVLIVLVPVLFIPHASLAERNGRGV